MNMSKIEEQVMPNLPLYHYTNIDVLLQMISSNTATLWAGCVSYMNDSTEFRYALNCLQVGIYERLIIIQEAKLEEDTDFPDEKKALDHLRQQIEQKSTEISSHYYVFSLSEDPDLLSQWRSYTTHKKGVSIGFSPHKIKQVCESNGFDLFKCVYHENESRRIVDALLDRYLCEYRRLNGGQCEDGWYEKLSECIEETYRLLLCIKHPAFSEEREWRLVSRRKDPIGSEVKYRVSGTMLVPYVEILIENKPFFHNIVCGPNDQLSLTYHALKNFEYKHNLSGSLVTQSSIPYREW